MMHTAEPRAKLALTNWAYSRCSTEETGNIYVAMLTSLMRSQPLRQTKTASHTLDM